MLVTKQCTWVLSGTVSLVVDVLELRRQLSSMDPARGLNGRWGSGITRSCSRRRVKYALNSLTELKDIDR